MSLQRTLIAFIERHFAVLGVTFLIVGVLAGERVAGLAFAIPWFMGVLMFSSALGLQLKDLNCLRGKPWILPVILVLLHLVMPLMAMGITTLLRLPLEAVMGFVILAVIPISATGIVWITVYRGNVTLGMAIILADTICAPFIIPYVLAFLFGADVHMDPARMLRGLFWMLFFPTILALVCNRVSHGELQRRAGKPIAFLGKLAVLAIFFTNGGVVSPYMREFDPLFIWIFATNLALAAFWFLFAFGVGRFLFGRKEDVLAFMLTAAMRGATTGMVIAMSYFPPLTTLTVVFNMLFMQPMGAWAGKVARQRLDKEDAGGAAPEGGE